MVALSVPYRDSLHHKDDINDGDDEIIEDTIDVDDSITGDYFNDKAYKAQFQQWVNDLWVEKDAKLDKLVESNNKE